MSTSKHTMTTSKHTCQHRNSRCQSATNTVNIEATCNIWSHDQHNEANMTKPKQSCQIRCKHVCKQKHVCEQKEPWTDKTSLWAKRLAVSKNTSVSTRKSVKKKGPWAKKRRWTKHNQETNSLKAVAPNFHILRPYEFGHIFYFLNDSILSMCCFLICCQILTNTGQLSFRLGLWPCKKKELKGAPGHSLETMRKQTTNESRFNILYPLSVKPTKLVCVCLFFTRETLPFARKNNCSSVWTTTNCSSEGRVRPATSVTSLFLRY